MRSAPQAHLNREIHGFIVTNTPSVIALLCFYFASSQAKVVEDKKVAFNRSPTANHCNDSTYVSFEVLECSFVGRGKPLINLLLQLADNETFTGSLNHLLGDG